MWSGRRGFADAAGPSPASILAPGPAAADGRKRGQPFCRHGLILRDEAAKRAVTRCNYEFFGAPVVTCPGLERSLNPWSIFDVGMLAMSVMLAAQEYGVDSIPAVNHPGGIGSLREPADFIGNCPGLRRSGARGEHTPEPPQRRSAQEMVRFEWL
ncbi:MAG: nitroreductase family protein [Clostridia bacterium]|nr:nitroreductase family protein [Clostridia bacterium]